MKFLERYKPRKKTDLILLIVGALMILTAVFFLIVFFYLRSRPSNHIDYAKEEAWAYIGEGEGDADVFFLPSQADYDSDENLDIADPNPGGGREIFLATADKERTLFKDLKLYLPYYRQVSVKASFMGESEEKQEIYKLPYYDTADSFKYYIENYNEGRPFILAGFGHGGEMILKLMEEEFSEGAYDDRFVCAYILGYGITDDVLAEYPHLKMAEDETGTGVIVSFTTETEGVEGSAIIPKGTLVRSINPLNWSTGSDVAEKDLNKGACFIGDGGKVTEETAGFTGAYISEERGSLIVTDVDPAGYTCYGDVNEELEYYNVYKANYPEGVTAKYDYQFFFKDIQENIRKRIDSFGK